MGLSDTYILFIMSAFGNGKKRRTQAQINNRLKQVKGVSKPTIEDIYPFDFPNLQAIPHEVRHYINELERQYIQRYNILVNNRIIYEEIIENMSTELDKKGVNIDKLSQIYQKCTTNDIKAKTSQNNS